MKGVSQTGSGPQAQRVFLLNPLNWCNNVQLNSITLNVSQIKHLKSTVGFFGPHQSVLQSRHSHGLLIRDQTMSSHQLTSDIPWQRFYCSLWQLFDNTRVKLTWEGRKEKNPDLSTVGFLSQCPDCCVSKSSGRTLK